MIRRHQRLLLAASAAAAGMVGASVVFYKNDLARAREAARRSSLLTHTDAGLIEYADIGAGVPLLSIHGAAGGFDQGLANATQFAGEGFRVIAPSRFGYLRTPIPRDTSPAAQADAHAALLTTLDLPKAIVLAVSAGARSAVELAIRHPNRVAALVLVVPGLTAAGPASSDPSRVQRLAFPVVRAGGDFAWWAAEKVAPLALLRLAGVRPALVAAAPQAERDRLMGILKRVEPVSLRLPGLGIDGRPKPRRLPLEAIGAPTLIVCARDDSFDTLPGAELAARQIRGARLVAFDTGGHLLVGRLPEVRAAVRAFLADAGLIPALVDRQLGKEGGKVQRVPPCIRRRVGGGMRFAFPPYSAPAARCARQHPGTPRAAPPSSRPN